MPRKQPIQPEDLYQVRMPTHCRVSPDGKRLVVSVSRQVKKSLKTEGHLWMTDLAEGSEPARQFTFGRQYDSNPRWSPDGSQIAFLSNRSGKSELWLIAADGGEARQLTELGGSIGDFVWHPSGRRLVVSYSAVDPETKERAEAKKRGQPGADSPKVRAIERIVYKMDGAGFLPKSRSHLWSVDAKTGRAKQLLSDDRYEESEPRFSPDGRWIYFASNRSADPDLDLQRVDLWRIPARGGEIERVRNFAGPSLAFSMSPDGKWLAFHGSPDPDGPWNQFHDKIYLIPAGGGRPIPITEQIDRGCENSTIGDVFGAIGGQAPIWSPDSRWIYFLVSNEGSTEVWRISRDRGRDDDSDHRRIEPVITDPGVVIDFEIDFEGGWIHYTWADVTNPGEIRSRPLPASSATPASSLRHKRIKSRGSGIIPDPTSLTRPSAGTIIRSRLNSDWLRDRKVLVPEELWFESSGRHPVQGWVLQPPGMSRSRKYPGLLYIHGGPAAQYGRVFFHEFQVLAGRGYVVFYSNPRGGTGYSQKHLNSIVNRWGTLDYRDLMTFTDVVLNKNRHVSRKRVAVAGGSYGGYMTNWIVGHTQRFACAVTQRSISNLLSFIGASDFGFAWPREFGKVGPWDDPAHYLKMSPLSYLHEMKTPILIEHQEEDHRCPIDQAEQLWAALRAKGVPAEFIRYPGEPHGMSRMGRPDRRIDRLERISGWLDRWLKK